MPVFRVEKNQNYTTMCNHHLRDQHLSLKGKGLLSMLLSLPDTWNYSVRGLAAIVPDGVDGVMTALKELEQLGYLKRYQKREANGRMGKVEYVIYEVPRSMANEKPCGALPCTENPDPGIPPTGESDPVFPAQLNTDPLNTKENNKRKKREVRHSYGAYQNVLLTDEELDKLQREFPSDFQSRIERLSEYIASSGRTYKNHLATIRSWARRNADTNGYSAANYSFREGESL